MKGKSERLTVWAFAVTMAGLMLLPYARYKADERDGWRFTGLLTVYPEDAAGHLSWARQAHDGALLFEPKFAGAEPRGRRVFNLLFLAMGHAARLTGLSVVQVFHVERTLAAILVLVAVYWFAAQFFAERQVRWLCLVLVATSAGLEWLSAPPPRVEVDLVQTSTFRALMTDVLIGPSTALLLLAPGFADRALRTGSRLKSSALIAGVTVLGQTAVHPLDVPTTFAVTGALAAVRIGTAAPGERRPAMTRGALVLGVMALCAAPLAAYHLVVLLADPVYRAYAGQRNDYLVTGWPMQYGLVLAAAAVGAAAIIRRRERDRALLVVWPAVVAVLLIRPVPVSLLQVYVGLHVALCALAARGLGALFARGGSQARSLGDRGSRASRVPWKPVLGWFALALFVGLGAVTNVLIFAREVRPHLPGPPRYLSADEVEALHWLESNAAPDDVVACLESAGVYVPLWTGCRTVVGEPAITPNAAERERQMCRLMGADGPLDPEAVRAILSAVRADYIYCERDARRLGSASLEGTLLSHHLATRVFHNATTALYRKKVSGTFFEKGS